MFLALQLPLADIRSFLPFQTYKTTLPTWPIPEPGKEFIRASGIVKRRCRGGLDSWPGEETYCDGRRALRFPNRFGELTAGAFSHSEVLDCAFRRFLSDGKAVSRFEVGFRADFLYPCYAREVLDVINSCLEIPVSLPAGNGPRITLGLFKSARYLARHYLESTTRRIKEASRGSEDWWLSPGAPLLLVEYGYEEISELPHYSSLVPHSSSFQSNITLHFCPIERNGKPLSVWFLRTDPDDLDTSRRLRLCLFRSHAERECLKYTLRTITQGKLKPQPHTEASDNLQQYLLNCVRYLAREKQYGLSQSSIVRAVQEFEDLVGLGERATLLSQLSDIRRNVYSNLEQFISPTEDTTRPFHVMGNINVYMGQVTKIGGDTVKTYEIKFGDNTKFVGNLVTADTIQGSFNKITTSAVSEELKTKLKTLSEAVADMCNHLPEDKAKEAARDLNALTEEALSKEPRRKWYELNSEGLIQAAKTVGEIAGPVVTAVKAVLSLLP